MGVLSSQAGAPPALGLTEAALASNTDRAAAGFNAKSPLEFLHSVLHPNSSRQHLDHDAAPTTSFASTSSASSGTKNPKTKLLSPVEEKEQEVMQQAVANVLEAHDFTERFQKELKKSGGKDVEAAAAAAARAQAEAAQMDGRRSSSGNSKSSFSDIAINITMNPDLLAFFAKLASTVANGLIDFGRITSAIFTSPMQLMQGGNVAGIIGGNVSGTAISVAAGEYLTPEVVQSMLPAVQNPREWIRHHNRSLDHGQKFMVYSRSPMIQYTDLFNLNRFGCFNGNDFDTKYWWHHPQIKFGVPLGEIRVTLQNDSTGELKWDAVYDLQGGTFLRHDAEPISGKHAFFTPDWCPGFSEMGVGNFGQGGAPATQSAMGGGGMGGGSYNTAHAYTLTVTNLGSKPSAGLGVVGKIQFNHYPFPLLETNYSYESDIGLEEMRTRTFDIPGIPISL